jgi:hypothetical protein
MVLLLSISAGLVIAGFVAALIAGFVTDTLVRNSKMTELTRDAIGAASLWTWGIGMIGVGTYSIMINQPQGGIVLLLLGIATFMTTSYCLISAFREHRQMVAAKVPLRSSH